MRLVYKGTNREAKVGDEVTTSKGEKAKIDFFRQPTSPASEGKISIIQPPMQGTREYFVSVVGLEWIEREDRVEPDSLFNPNDVRPAAMVPTDEEAPRPRLTPGHYDWPLLVEDFDFGFVADYDGDPVLYSGGDGSNPGNSADQMEKIADLVNASPTMLKLLRKVVADRDMPCLDAQLQDEIHLLIERLAHIKE